MAVGALTFLPFFILCSCYSAAINQNWIVETHYMSMNPMLMNWVYWDFVPKILTINVGDTVTIKSDFLSVVVFPKNDASGMPMMPMDVNTFSLFDYETGAGNENYNSFLS